MGYGKHEGECPLGWDLTWLTLLGLWQQELSRWLEVVAGDKHQLLELEELLYVLADRQKNRLNPGLISPFCSM